MTRLSWLVLVAACSGGPEDRPVRHETLQQHDAANEPTMLDPEHADASTLPETATVDVSAPMDALSGQLCSPDQTILFNYDYPDGSGPLWFDSRGMATPPDAVCTRVTAAPKFWCCTFRDR